MKKKQLLSTIFKKEPLQWGLRGDPYLWEEMKNELGNLSYPNTKEELIALIERTYEQLVGMSLLNDRDSVFIERYSHGGMSSGRVSPVFWSEKAIPMLRRRYLKSRRDNPSTDTSKDVATTSVINRLLQKTPPSIGLRIIPKPLFTGLLGLKQRLYVCIADYDEVKGLPLAKAVEMIYGGFRRTEEDVRELYGNWVNLQLGSFTEEVPQEIHSYPEYYVIKLDLDSANDLDLFPGTWKSIAFILSDKDRMKGREMTHEQFKQNLDNYHLFGDQGEGDLDFYELDQNFSKAEYVGYNPQNRYYDYVTASSNQGNDLTDLFGIYNRCWHGKGYIGSDGLVICRVFLVRNVLLSYKNLISCTLMKREDIL